MNKLSIALFLIWTIGSTLSCSTLSISSYDSRPLVIRTYNLFNQRLPPLHLDKDWKGDWVFRRERLEIIDKELRLSKPDILIFQQLLQKKDNLVESDTAILSEGSLLTYEWQEAPVRFYEDTNETEFHSVAYNLPLRWVSPSLNLPQVHKFKEGVLFTHTVLAIENERVLLINLELIPEQSYEFEAVAKAIKFISNSLNICEDRIIIAGYLGRLSSRQVVQSFQKHLALKNASIGFCELEQSCYTSTPLNELYLVTSRNNNSFQSDYLYVPESSLVRSTSLTFNNGYELPQIKQKYNFTKLWGSRTFGLETSLILKKCK